MPQPSIFDKLSFVWSQLMDPCDAPITVYVANTIRPAGVFLLSWFALDIKQIIISAVRPTKAFSRKRSQPHGSRGKKGRRGPYKIPGTQIFDWDPNNEIGKKLPGADDLRGREISKGIAFLWVIEGAIERLLFWWMVIDLTTNFLFDWLSGVNESEYCQARDDAVLLLTDEGNTRTALTGWTSYPFDTTAKSRNMTFVTGFGASQDVGGGMAIFTVSIRMLDPDDQGTYRVRLRKPLSNSVPNLTEESVAVPKGATVEVGVEIPVLAGELVVWEDLVEGQPMIVESSNLLVHAPAPKP